MNAYRDHLLFLVAGLMIGFILAYAAFESIGSQQPARRAPGAAEPATGAGGAGQPPTETAPGGANFGMEQVQQLSAFVQANPDNAEAVLQLANMNFDIRNWSRAVELYERYVTLEPESPELPDVLSDLGICYRSQGQFQEALEAFDRAQVLSPDHWESLFNEVVVHAFDLGDFEAAEEGLERLRELSPDHPDVERLSEAVEQRRQAAPAS